MSCLNWSTWFGERCPSSALAQKWRSTWPCGARRIGGSSCRSAPASPTRPPCSCETRRQLLAEQPDPEDFYRTELLPKKTRLYREYVESRSFRADLILIFKTISSVVAR